jgi:pyruvate/2-oxoglutarate dehydrogenase complex dihydrolipoamide dehydrogenase (E3) component
VEVWERSDVLGGALNVASIPPYKGVLLELADFLASDARRAGARIHTGREIGLDAPGIDHFTHVLTATGARPADPPFETLDPGRMITADELLRKRDVAPGRYLVIGGGMVGLETADHLCALPGLDVTVTEMSPEFGAGVAPIRLKLVLDRLIRAGANLLARACVMKLDGAWVELELPSGRVTLGPFNTVVLATGYRSEPPVICSETGNPPVTLIGDALKPGTLADAVRDGFEAAMKISI